MQKKTLVSTGKRYIDTDITLSVDGKSVCEIKKTEFPGVMIDKKLTWKEHITFISEMNISGNRYGE